MSRRLHDYAQDIERALNNPTAVQRVVLDTLEESLDGDYGVVDPSNPFVFLLETSVATGVAGMQQDLSLLRKRYPSLAQTPQDLYHHMTDEDYVGRFAFPSETTFKFLLSADEIQQRAIVDENGVQRMVIPRDTEITIEGSTFTLEYPIEIRRMTHGNLQVVYNVSSVSPLKRLASNQVDWRIIRMPSALPDMANMAMLEISVPMHQFKIEDHYDQLNPSTGFTRVYNHNNDFVHARVWVLKRGEWEEIHTTHSDLVYDKNRPTAMITVLEGQVEVHIPQIYFTNDIEAREVRVDLYTSKGPIDECFERYEPRSFQTRWRDLQRQDNPYVAPIRSFDTLVIYSDDCTRGGQKQMSFEALRDRIINNATGTNQIPITPNQLANETNRLGFQIVKDVDNLTNRIYLASRSLPSPESEVLSSPVGCTIKTLELTSEDLVQYPNVYDNGDRITLFSGTLFTIGNGLLEPLNTAKVQELNNASPSEKVELINDNDYFYTPFHYVLDTTNEAFEMRAYYLDYPEVSSKYFVGENQTTQLQVVTLRYGMSILEDRFRLTIYTASGDAFKGLQHSQIHPVLSYIPPGESSRAYLAGTIQGTDEDGELIIQFDLHTNFDVDDNDSLIVDNFAIVDDTTPLLPLPLQQSMDLAYFVSGYSVEGMETSDIENYMSRFVIPEGSVGVTHERLDMQLGYSLDSLWRRTRSLGGPHRYQRYESDVYAYYTETVYDRDPNTGLINMTWNETDGVLEYAVLHYPNDPVLDSEGNPVKLYSAGDVKLDNDGNPIPYDNMGRRVLREFDLLLFEAGFQYVTDRNSVNYLIESRESLVAWIIEELPDLQNRLLENTHIWYYPQSNIGTVDVLVQDGQSVSINAEQTFKIEFFMTRQGYNNLDLRESLTNTARRVIAENLQKQRVSVNAMAAEIKSAVGSEVIDVAVMGLGGEENYEVVTLQDENASLAIKKRLTVLSNQDVAIEDDLLVDFVRHEA